MKRSEETIVLDLEGDTIAVAIAPVRAGAVEGGAAALCTGAAEPAAVGEGREETEDAADAADAADPADPADPSGSSGRDVRHDVASVENARLERAWGGLAGLAGLAAAFGALMNGAGLRAAATRRLAVLRELRAEAYLAAGIGIAAIVLAVVSGSGAVDFPGVALERALQSHQPASTAEPDRVIDDRGLPDAALTGVARPDVGLAERLVEDPIFEPPELTSAGHRLANASALGGRRSSRYADGGAGGNGDIDAQDAKVLLPAAAVAAPTAPQSASALQAARVLAGAAPVPAPGRPAAQAHAALAIGDISVQLVAVVRRDQASKAWVRLRDSNRDLLANLNPRIIDPDGTLFTLYRLRAGPFVSAREAQALCATLAERRVDCMVVDNSG